jgi:hypothetical protein
LGLVLACGHPKWEQGGDLDPAAATGYLFACEEPGCREHQEVVEPLGAVREADADAMDAEALVAALFGERLAAFA